MISLDEYQRSIDDEILTMMAEQQGISLESLVKGKRPSAWKALIYGTPGCGKSTLAAYAPSPVFLDLESGLDRVDCVKTPDRLTNLTEVKDWLRLLLEADDVKTVVIDTIDELDKMLSEKVIEAYNRDTKKHVRALSDIPYGRGGDLLSVEWKEMVNILDFLRLKGKNVLLIGHEQIVKFENPEGENYDFYTVNIHKKSAPVVIAKMDAVLFARHEAFVKAKDTSDKHVAVASGKRMLHTLQGGSWVAKNRFNLPETIEMEPSVFNQFI